MAFNTAQTSVTTSATLIKASNASRTRLRLENSGSDILYIGSDNAVTTANGFPIYIDEILEINDLITNIYGIAASGTTAMTLEEE